MKILIVDDEVIIRNGLAQVIDWQELGLELLAPAESAEEALQRMALEQPDILMTDIQMNGKTGLQLAEEVNEKWPDIEILILSGYDDFSYAQQAIRQNVGDYMLKTSRPEEIVKAVMKAKQRIVKRLGQRSQERGQEQEERLRVLREWVVEGLTAGQQTARIDTVFALLSAERNSLPHAMRIVVFEAEGWDGPLANHALLLFAINNMLGDLLPCISFMHQQRIITIWAAEEGKDWTAARMDALIGKVEGMLKCCLYAAVGTPVDAIEALHNSYLAAEYAARYRSWLPGKWIQAESVMQRTGSRSRITNEEELALSAVLLDDDLPGLKSWVSRYISHLLEDSEATLDSLEAALDSAVLSAHRWLEQVLAATGREQAVADLPVRLQPQIAAVPAKERLFQLLHGVMKAYHYELADGQKAYVRRAMAYVESHLGRDVSLQQVARQVHLNVSHFSEVFKKETGMTFGDYVIRRKISKAQEILTTTPVKISEVAASVGYEDVKYFGQLFKKHTGKTPSEYRGKPEQLD